MPNFVSSPKCRLINPAKTQIGRVSKVELDKINSIISTQVEVNQWRSTSTVMDWFCDIPEKHQHRFLPLHINEKLLSNVITFAKRFTEISDETIKIIRNARKSLLFISNSV